MTMQIILSHYSNSVECWCGTRGSAFYQAFKYILKPVVLRSKLAEMQSSQASMILKSHDKIGYVSMSFHYANNLSYKYHLDPLSSASLKIIFRTTPSIYLSTNQISISLPFISLLLLPL